MTTEWRLDGHRVLVTGSARGLGESFVRALVDAGARVAISDVLHDRGRALAQELGSSACYVPMDLLDPAAIEAGVAEAARLLGGLDGLINNYQQKLADARRQAEAEAERERQRIAQVGAG
jgi:NAD(P)-dependent dehydrogenase (short-subunit alcohol dehydrogenase family)